MSAHATPRVSRRDERAALFALAFLLVTAAVWWAVALWPTPGAPPAWLARARWVCFNVGPSGLPDAAGWLLLVGQPLGLLAVLIAAWPLALGQALARLRASRAGRALLAGSALCIAAGLAAAAVRVAQASAFDPSAGPAGAPELPVADLPRDGRDAPELGLVDQRGRRLDLARLHGRPALVTFAFGHCESVCPALVQEVRDAQRRVRESGAALARTPRVAVVTLDPWRDTPSRLPALARSWGLDAGDDAFVLSGPVGDVSALLERWNVPRERDPVDGQIRHPALVYVLDAEGRIAFASNGGAAALVELVARAEPGR